MRKTLPTLPLLSGGLFKHSFSRLLIFFFSDLKDFLAHWLQSDGDRRGVFELLELHLRHSGMSFVHSPNGRAHVTSRCVPALYCFANGRACTHACIGRGFILFFCLSTICVQKQLVKLASNNTPLNSVLLLFLSDEKVT